MRVIVFALRGRIPGPNSSRAIGDAFEEIVGDNAVGGFDDRRHGRGWPVMWVLRTVEPKPRRISLIQVVVGEEGGGVCVGRGRESAVMARAEDWGGLY